MFASLKPPLRTFSGLFIALALCLALIGSARAEKSNVADIPSDQVVVKLKFGVSINTILARYNATLLGTLTETNLYFLQLPAGQTADQLLPGLNADPDLYYAEPNYYSDGSPSGGFIMFGPHMAPLAEFIMFGPHGDITPAPPDSSTQWAWSKINLADAQKISRGQGIIVAVLDTGLAPDHPLLNSNITAGYNFVAMSNDIYDRGNGIDDTGNGQVDEFVGHGTHVSGIIVTEAPGVQIMPIRVLNSDGVGTYWEVAAGIKYAVDHGARIINMSLSAPRLTPSLADALAYAASHNVLVVAAAGVGTGPNYPAAYSNPLGVIGVGASDQNDGIPWFSGGQVSDTDVYAPGVDIYSAFPYGGYGLGSGTSMSTPIISGEAALLMARYPDWSVAQIAQRIVSKTEPMIGSSVGRVNLSKALNTGLEVDYAVGDIGSPNDNNIKPRLRFVNNTPEDIPLRELKVRYWYTIDSDQPETFNCDHTTLAAGCGGLTNTFVRLPVDSMNRNALSDTYLEVGFMDNAGYLPGGGQLEMYLRFNKSDWSNYVEANDYSYDGNKTVPTRWDHITLYRNGTLVWGVEPIGNPGGSTATIVPTSTASRTATMTVSIPSPTRTPTQMPTYTPARTSTATPPPATNTATRTATQVPVTNTATRTATQVPATNTPTRTVTSLPPTATSLPTTATPSGVSAIKVQYSPGTTAASSQAISPKLILLNTGSTNIPYSELKIRYWFTEDGTQPQTYWCDYGGNVSCANISAQFVTLPARAGADFYLELSFASGAGSLASGANSGQIQSRFSKNDWTAYTQTGDYSFNSAFTQFTDWNHITVYRNGTLIWGTEP